MPPVHASSRAARRTLRAAGALLFLAGTEFAHGALAAPPPYLGPPDRSRPATGANTPSAPPFPTPSGATSPGSQPPGAIGTPATAGGQPGSPLSFDAYDGTDWSWWWLLHREVFLQLRGRIARNDPRTGGDGYFLGHGAREAPEAGSAPDETTVRNVVLPALLSALAEGASNDVQSACLIALARTGDDFSMEERASLVQTLAPFLGSAVQELRETAALSLGVLGWAPSAPLLASLMLDDPAGRRAVGGGEVDARTRAFAAYGLGLLANGGTNEDVRRFAVRRLASVLEQKEGGTPDLHVAAAIALGRTPLPWSGALTAKKESHSAAESREAQVRFVAALVDDERRHRFVRAHALVSLAYLLADVDEAVAAGHASAAPLRAELLPSFWGPLESPRKAPDELVQSAAIGAGLLADDDDDPVDVHLRTALFECSARGANRGAERFALLALGRAGGRRGSGTSGTGASDVRARLLRDLARGRGGLDDWAGLGLALLERGRIEAGRLPDRDVADALRAKLADAREPSELGAMAIAVGIERDPNAIQWLLDGFERTGDDAVRGYLAVGVGLLGERTASERLRGLLDDAQWRPTLLREVAIALGLLGDPDTVDVLVQRFRDTDSLAVRASIAQALGRIGDGRAVAPLAELLAERSTPALARALAAAALGLVADRDGLPFGTLFSLDANHLAAPPTLFDGQGRGVLDIL